MSTTPHRVAVPRVNQFIIAAITVCCVALVFAFSFPTMHGVDRVYADAGLVTLDERSRAGAVELSGEWLRVTGALVAPESADSASWGPARTPEGVRGASLISYRLRLQGLDPQRQYALYLMEVASAYEVFANGGSVVRHGRLDHTARGGAAFTPQMVFDLPRGEAIDLLLHVTNRVQFRGGIWQPVYFGPRSVVTRLRHGRIAIELFILSTVIVVVVYHLILYALNSRDRSTLFLALFSIPVAAKVALSGQQLWLSTIAAENETAWIRLAYQAIVVAVPLYLRHNAELFPRTGRLRVVRGFAILAAVYSPVLWAMPFSSLQRTFWIWNLLVVAGLVVSIVWTSRELRDGSAGSLPALLGLGFLFVFAANDILFDTRLIDTGYFLSAGLFGFMISQAIVIATRFHVVSIEANYLRETLEHQVRQQTDALRAERNRMRELARTDDMTRLINRRYGTELLRDEVARFLRYREGLALLLIDIDHFKHINDTRGHAVGDDVLRGFATILIGAVRATDRVVRWGGEEFLLILPDTTEAAAESLAHKLLGTVATTAIETRDGSVPITFSAGVCGVRTAASQLPGFHPQEARGESARGHATSAENSLLETMLRLADAGLYRAKAAGRNRVERAESSLEPA